MNEKVCIVAPIWDDYAQSEFTDHFINQMLYFVNGNIEVIIVDNASPSPITKQILGFYQDPRFHVIHNETNLGYGKAANIGVKKGIELGAEYIIVMNQDVDIKDPDWIENSFLSYLRDNPKCIMGARLIDFNENCRYDGVHITSYLEGWMLVCHKDVWLDIGGFDEHIFNWHEDAEFCIRAVQKGYALKQSDAFYWKTISGCENPPVFHYYGRTGYVNLDYHTVNTITEQSRQYVVQKHFSQN